jgi:hypothetical protein
MKSTSLHPERSVAMSGSNRTAGARLESSILRAPGIWANRSADSIIEHERHTQVPADCRLSTFPKGLRLRASNQTASAFGGDLFRQSPAGTHPDFPFMHVIPGCTLLDFFSIIQKQNSGPLRGRDQEP